MLTRSGGKFTIRLLHPITPVLYESLLFALIGDQFDEADNVVGCVLSVRQTEDIMSVWVEEEGEGVRSGLLREKILSLLNLPPSTQCEYRSNKALLDAASSLKEKQADGTQEQSGGHHYAHGHHSHGHREHGQGFGTRHQHQERQHGQHQHERGHFRDPRGPRDDGERRTGWGNGFRREGA